MMLLNYVWKGFGFGWLVNIIISQADEGVKIKFYDLCAFPLKVPHPFPWEA